MPGLQAAAWSDLADRSEVAEALAAIGARFSEQQFTKLRRALLRHVFLIELVKRPKIETTKFRTRWCEQLNRDQRFCSFEECLAIFDDLVTFLAGEWLNENQHEEILKLFLDHSLLSYEVPLDYLSVPSRTDPETRIHTRGNIAWRLSEHAGRTVRLRKHLTDTDTSPDAVFFRKVLDNKIYVKTYLTDRVLTGSHKTNREKRWEVHPHSVHFATRMACLEIEYALIVQMCSFEGFPLEARRRLHEAGMLPPDTGVFRCPITLIPMSFDVLQDELLNPTHGKSTFQVGHLNPLKLDAPDSAASGHTAENISWISSDGNRIQGSMSLNDVRQLLRQVVRNYEAEEMA